MMDDEKRVRGEKKDRNGGDQYNQYLDPSKKFNELFTKSLLADKYKILKKIGSGSFGIVYHAINVTNNREVAVKAEIHGIVSQLQYESRIYKILSDGKHVPYARLYTAVMNKQVLVMDLLGPSLEELFYFCDRKFSMKTVCMLADQMISVIEYVHQNSIIHCDIKPDNFLLGIAHQSNRVFIIDFGLSKQYRTSTSLNHVRYSNNRSLTGTARYVSINAHVGIEQSRRDDLESIGYVLIYFCIKCLPWQGIVCKGRKQKYDRICEKKLSTSVEDLCAHLPSEFVVYIKYCRLLRYDENPDYQIMRSLFRAILKSIKQKYDLMFDWRDPKYANMMKEYLINTCPSFADLLSTSGEKSIVDQLTDSNPKEGFLKRFLEKYPNMSYDKISFSIKNFYRNYLSIPSATVKNQSNTHINWSTTNNQTS